MRLWSKSGLHVIHGDFTKQKPPAQRFNLVLTNPPYVRHHHLHGAEKHRLKAQLARSLHMEISGLAGLYCYFLLLCHDNHHRLFQVYGWEEKKTKTSWGGNSVDHEKLAKARIGAMTAADLNRFMVACALVPDLYCPGYSSAEVLSKETNLMRTAVRYKVDASKIANSVNADLSKTCKGGKTRRGSAVKRKVEG